MITFRYLIVIFLAGLLAFNAASAGAAVIFLGPSPYLSRADSPFPVDGSNPNFYLEDFEDAELNTPGMYQPLTPATHGVILSRPAANSVDADDGAIDGLITEGHSLRSSFYMFRPTDPPISTSFLRFAFDSAMLKALPNAFGVALTYSPGPAQVQLEAFDANFQRLGIAEFSAIAGGSGGDERDDRFVGLVVDGGIHFVELRATYVGAPGFIEVDHVQYGFSVPEPAGSLSVAFGLFISIFRRSRHA